MFNDKEMPKEAMIEAIFDSLNIKTTPEVQTAVDHMRRLITIVLKTEKDKALSEKARAEYGNFQEGLEKVVDLEKDPTERSLLQVASIIINARVMFEAGRMESAIENLYDAIDYAENMIDITKDERFETCAKLASILLGLVKE